jgi:uncharacterized UBP type Zn finger protein
MAVCKHVEQIQKVGPGIDGCEECLRTGGQWVNLRLCLICGHVGCCDSSPGQHASRHYRETGHPIVQLGIKGHEELWCFADDIIVTES